MKTRRTSLLTLLAAVVAGALIGAGGGVGTYAALSSGDKTVVRQVTVGDSQPAANTSGLSVNAIYKLAHRGVVEVKVATQSTDPFGGTRQQSAEGSGFVYDTSGHIVTNQHVVADATSVRVTFWNGKTYDARVVGTDSSTDLAVLDVSAPSTMLYPLTVGDSSDVEVGDNVVAIGAPFGLAEPVRDRRLDPDGRGDQPRQLRRAAARRPGSRDRRQRADRERLRRQRRRRVRDPVEHDQVRRRPADLERQGRARVSRRAAVGHRRRDRRSRPPEHA